MLAKEARVRQGLEEALARDSAASIARISLTSSRGHGHLLHPSRAGPLLLKSPPGETIRRGPRPRSPGRGPHAHTAQFLMRAVLRSRCSFGPILIAHQHSISPRPARRRQRPPGAAWTRRSGRPGPTATCGLSPCSCAPARCWCVCACVAPQGSPGRSGRQLCLVKPDFRF